MRAVSLKLIIFSFALAMIFSFNNCSDVAFKKSAVSSKTTSVTDGLGESDGGPTSEETDPDETPTGEPPPPLVETVGVVTVLLALGDQVQQQLVVSGESSRTIAETAVRYASPETNPRILVVRDRNNNGETFYDTNFITDVLLSNYEADLVEEPEGGILPSDVLAYDLVWFNNPGYPMGLSTSRDTLIDFTGGVVLSGDDLSRGNGFSLLELTGLNHINNGTTATCGGDTHYINNNQGDSMYSVRLLQEKIPDVDVSALTFYYGNDIDLSTPTETVEVIAEARADEDGCDYDRPVIVRYEKAIEL